MKRGIVIAVILVVVLALVAVLILNIFRPQVSDAAKADCAVEPGDGDYRDCIGREKLIEACYDIEDEEKLLECFNQSTYNGLETPEITLITGRLSE